MSVRAFLELGTRAAVAAGALASIVLATGMRVGDRPETVYRAGDGFYEEINAPHLMSANASASERARFVVFFTCDTEGPLSAPIKDVVR